jgi:terminase small subunit-like protein
MSTVSTNVNRAARQMLLEFWGDQILDIADDEELDPRSRQIRTATRQWLMSKLAPQRYGDKVQIGGDPESPLQVMHSQVSLSELTDAQLEALQNFTKSLLVDAAQE